MWADRADRAQRGARVSEFPNIWAVQPVAYDGMQGLQFAMAHNRVPQWAASLAPPFERYKALRTALGQYRRIQAQGGWATLIET